MKIIRSISLFLLILWLFLSLSYKVSSQINTTQRRPENNSQAQFPITPPNGPPDPCTDPRLPCPVDSGVVYLIVAGIVLGALKARAKASVPVAEMSNR
jgi:hypothetical protein